MRFGFPPFALLLLFILSLMPLAPVAEAQTDVHLRAESRAFTRLPVELWPTERLAAATMIDGDTVRSVLESDLWLSGIVEAYVTRGGFDRPLDSLMADGRPPAPRSVRFAIKPAVEVNGDQAVLGAELIDLRSRRTIERKRYTGCQRKLRLMTHALADDMIKTLTGEDGIARSRIAFSATGFEGKELFLMDYDGVNLRQLTRDGTLNLTPDWLAGANGLVYISYKNRNPDLHVFDLQSSRSGALIGGNDLYSSPAWSPDGKTLALVSTKDGNAEIYLFAPQSKRMTRLTYHGAIDASPSWAPSGREIVFTSDRLGNPQLFVMDAEGSNVRRLPVEGKYVDSPAWSPRGDKIAYVSRNPGGFDVYLYDLATETSTRLTNGEGSNEDPAWSPNGYRIAFSSNRSGGREIYSMFWDGTNVERLTVKGSCASPAWSANLRPGEDFSCDH